MADLLAKNIAVAGSRNYQGWLYEMHELFKAGTGVLRDNWAIVRERAGSVWTSEASPVLGDYFCIQCTTAWADASYQEFMFGWQNSAGALGGYTATVTGIQIIGAARGSATWNGGTFAYDAPQTGILGYNVTLSASNFHVWAWPESLMFMVDSAANGTYNTATDFGFYGGRLDCQEATVKPCCCMPCINPRVYSSNGYYCLSSTTDMKVLKDDETGYVNCCLVSTTAGSGYTCDDARMLGRKSGKVLANTGLTVLDLTAAKSVGDWQRVRRVPWSVGTEGTLVTLGTSTYCEINGLLLPWSV
jgi:hypothetical protein